ncbi:hypothetical protein EUGRSUZ_G01647 [Eucalyptus grandis]|uniref:Uncharacterized protein n=2 Tax=Eucalyptus grandis TaxID=71139 RepID=A0ACC3K3S1_EUCGR|nr:hypothetical protein EUGRSUZ_G01647 [Eucalyptus grandis]
MKLNKAKCILQEQHRENNITVCCCLELYQVHPLVIYMCKRNYAMESSGVFTLLWICSSSSKRKKKKNCCFSQF